MLSSVLAAAAMGAAAAAVSGEGPSSLKSGSEGPCGNTSSKFAAAA